MNDMITGILSSAAFLALTVLVGFGFLFVRRRELMKIFDLSRKKQISIYLSRIEVRVGGACGPDGQPRAFSGATVSANETRFASSIAALFESLVPGLDTQPGILKTLFTRDIAVSVSPSPLQFAPQTVEGTIITVGSPGYNSVSGWAQTLHPKVTFSPANDMLVTHSGRQINDPQVGMVQILYDAHSQRRVFLLGGISESGTVAALLYTAQKWRELSTLCGKQDVICCLVTIQDNHPVLQEIIN